MKRSQQAQAALLKEQLEKLSGKKVVYTESKEIEEVEKEIKKLEDENKEGYKDDVKKLKVKLAALKLSSLKEETIIIKSQLKKFNVLKDVQKTIRLFETNSRSYNSLLSLNKGNKELVRGHNELTNELETKRESLKELRRTLILKRNVLLTDSSQINEITHTLNAIYARFNEKLEKGIVIMKKL